MLEGASPSLCEPHWVLGKCLSPTGPASAPSLPGLSMSSTLQPGEPPAALSPVIRVPEGQPCVTPQPEPVL